MSGIIGKKIGMTSFFDANGKYVPCTVIEAGPCVVTQVKTNEKDGYTALQLAYDDKKEKHPSSAMKGHFELAKTTPKPKFFVSSKERNSTILRFGVVFANSK